MKHTKTIITYVFATLLLLGIILFFIQMYTSIETPITSDQPFEDALWNTWGTTILIVAFIIFASGAGILVLLGGEWKWD